MDGTEWIPHTTKSGKILYYINPATGECKWQNQLNKEDSQSSICNTDINSKQSCTQVCRSSSRRDGEEVIASTSAFGSKTTVSESWTQERYPILSNSTNPSPKGKDEKEGREKSENDVQFVKNQERQMTVDVLAECKTARIHCIESGAVTVLQTSSSHSGSAQVTGNESSESVVQQEILQCPQCTEEFSCPNKFTTHLRSHPGIDPLKCPVCSKEYSSSTSLSTHLRTHTGEKPFSCPRCPKCFSQSSHLTTHMRVHTGEKPYQCPKCPKTFGQSSHLTLHLRIHNGEKPFQCRFCSKGFSHSSALSTHMRTHTGEKPFQCPNCPKKFCQSSHLKIHVRTHTGERPFQCPHCQKCFRQSCYLTKHVRGHLKTEQSF